VALLSTVIQTSFEYKHQTLMVFLVISGAYYDNVLIDAIENCESDVKSSVAQGNCVLLWKSASGGMCGVQEPIAEFGSQSIFV
jgi:hypothetical protein